MNLLTPKKKWWQFWMKRCVSCGGAYTNYGVSSTKQCLPCFIKSAYEVGAIAPDDPETPAAYRTILSQMLSLGILKERKQAVSHSRKPPTVTEATEDAVVCSLCHKNLEFMGQFGGAFGPDASVKGSGDPHDFDMWRGQVCVPCRFVFCPECIEVGQPTPCPECGRPTEPAYRGTINAMGGVRKLAESVSVKGQPKEEVKKGVSRYVNVSILDVGPNRLKVMKAIRSMEHIVATPDRVKQVVDNAPCLVVAGVPDYYAEHYAKLLREAGADPLVEPCERPSGDIQHYSFLENKCLICGGSLPFDVRDRQQRDLHQLKPDGIYFTCTQCKSRLAYHSDADGSFFYVVWNYR